MDTLTLSTILAPAVGEASKRLVNYLKASPWFNLLDKQDGKGKKHIAVLMTTTALSLIVAYLTGSLTDDVLSDAILIAMNALFAHGSAVTSHELSKAA